MRRKKTIQKMYVLEKKHPRKALGGLFLQRGGNSVEKRKNGEK